MDLWSLNDEEIKLPRDQSTRPRQLTNPLWWEERLKRWSVVIGDRLVPPKAPLLVPGPHFV